MGTEMNVEAERAALARPRDYLAWWTSIETDVRKSMLVFAHREPERLHALVRLAYEAGQQSMQAAACRAAQPADVGAGELPKLPGIVGEWADADPLRIACVNYGDLAAMLENYARDAIAADRRARQSQGAEAAARDAFALAWRQALNDAAFYVAGHCANGDHHAEIIVEMLAPKLAFRGSDGAAPPLSSEQQAEKGEM